MKNFNPRTSLSLTFIFTAIMAASPALAGNRSWTEGYHGSNHPQQVAHNRYEGERDHGHRDYHPGERSGQGRRHFFTDQHRVVIHNYYTDQYRRGHCPPGWAKKHNHCAPYGQTKNWVIGRPLPREVVYYNLPPSLVVQLGPAPSHHRFVRVAQDILLLATGTGMVVDAVDNLHWELGH